MNLFILLMILCLAVLESAVAQTDSIRPTETNLIVLCAGRSDLVAHVKVASMSLIRKPTEPNLVDLSVYGRLFALEVKQVYHREDASATFPTNIYLYRGGAMGGSLLEPNLEVGHEYLVFLKQEKAPEIVKKGVITDPPLPAINYFTFVRLPQREMPKRKAYVQIADTNILALVEKCLLESRPVRYEDGRLQEH